MRKWNRAGWWDQRHKWRSRPWRGDCIFLFHEMQRSTSSDSETYRSWEAKNIKQILVISILVKEEAKWKWIRSVVSDSSRPHGLQPTRLLRPWDFPGKSTGVGAQGICKKNDSGKSKGLGLSVERFQERGAWKTEGYRQLARRTKSIPIRNKGPS